MPQSSSTPKYIRDTCRELHSQYDREALALLCDGGVLPTSDNEALEQAIARLTDEPDGVTERMVALQEKSVTALTVDKRRRAMVDLEELENDRSEGRVVAAYLLGIAVGRRLGPEALRVAGGAR